MRKSFDTLGTVVREYVKRDVLDGVLFLFVGRDCRRAKVLFWDGTGPHFNDPVANHYDY